MNTHFNHSDHSNAARLLTSWYPIFPLVGTRYSSALRQPMNLEQCEQSEKVCKKFRIISSR